MKKGGSLASDNVVGAVDCKTFDSMNTHFDNNLTINVFKGGALIKSDEISYKIFNEQLGGGDCTGCAGETPAAPLNIGSMQFAPPLASIKGSDMITTQDMYTDTRGVLPSMYSHISDYPVKIDGVSFPSTYENIPNMSLYSLYGGMRKK